MEKRSLLSTLEKMDARLFIGLLFLYQVIFIFQGFDIADEGFHATFYQQLYSNPESVQYNFMFWLSGIAGNLFSGFGLWFIRLGGVLVITSTVIVVYNLLKRYMHHGHLKLGLFLAVILLNNNRKTLYYDNLSLLFYVLIIFFLFAGLRDKKQWKFFVSGIFIALSIFTRPPNVMALGLGVVILYYGYLNKHSFKQVIIQLLFWAGGLVFAVVAQLAIMKLIGHYDLFINSLSLVFSMGTEEGARSYGVVNLIKNYYPPYSTGLIYTIIILLLVAFAVVVPAFIRSRSFLLSLIKWGIRYGLLAVVLAMIILDKEENILSLYLFTGLTSITGILILLSNADKNIKTLMLAGCFIVAVYPFGSSAGLYTVGINTFWIAFPLAIDYLFNLQSLSSNTTFLGKQSSYSLKLGITPEQLRQIRTYTLALLVFACLFHAYFYPYFDSKNRIKMHYSINNKYLKGIFTSEERAGSFNGLLTESARHIKPGDYVLAYDCMPMFHYVTETKPYIGNSWPYLYQKDVFKAELDKAYQKTGILPVVVRQTIKTTGSGSDWPTTPLKYDPEWEERNKGRNAFLDEFLATHHYKEVWTNGVFKILVPETPNP